MKKTAVKIDYTSLKNKLTRPKKWYSKPIPGCDHLTQAEREKALNMFDKIGEILFEFEKGFLNELPLLKEENIKWSVHLQNNRYEHFGCYIQFKLGKRILKMDFLNAKQYRYEFNPYGNSGQLGTMNYDNWEKEQFLVWIYDNLIAEKILN